MKIDKTIANCTVPEFLRQSMKLKDTIPKWMNETGALKILRQRPKFTGEETDEERAEITEKTFYKNLEEALVSACDTHAELTAKLIGELCFVDEEDICKYEAIEFIIPVLSLFRNKTVTGFFTSLLRETETGM